MWVLTLATVFLCVGLNAGQKARLTWNGIQLANNSFLSNQQLAFTGTYNIPIRCELTTNSSAATRQWYSPLGTALPTRSTSGYGQTLVQATGVDLYSGGISNITQGVHRCDLTDGNGTLYRLYVAIYNEPSVANSWATNVSIQFQLVTPLPVDPPVFQLSCTTVNFPATTFKWTYNGSQVNASNFTAFQVLLDPLSSTYKNVLVVTGKMTGAYSFSVNTSCTAGCGALITLRSSSSSITIPAPPSPPTQVTVSQIGTTTLRVSWNPASGGGPTSWYYILTGTEGALTYNTATSILPYYDMDLTTASSLISVAAMGTYLMSSFTPITPIVTLTTTSNSITLTWRQPADPFGIGAVDRYEVYYSYVGPCPAIIHRGMETMDSSSTSLTLLGIQEFSTYNLTINAVKNGGSSMSSVQVQMPTSAPDAPPSAVAEAARSPTSLSVWWGTVPCISQNSLIVKYLVRYSQLYGSRTTAETTEYFFTANGLVPYTSYTFEVAAVNSAGQKGPFSAPFTMDTKLGPPTIIRNQSISATSVLVSWTPSDGDGATRYSVSYAYQGQCSGVSSAGMVYTTATQYTIQSLQEYSTYAVTVRAERGGQVTVSNSTVSTLSAAPSAPPSGLSQISKTTTKVSVGWGPVPCINRDSDISKYRVRYKSLNNSSAVKQDETFAMVFTATELDPYIDYSFEVAAINTDGLVGPYTAPLIVRTLQPVPPVITITTDGSTPTDQGNFLMNCSVPIPPEALGTVTIRWFSPQRVVLNSMVASDVGGKIIELDLVFTPIRTQDGGWYSCNVTFELYPQSGASGQMKITVQSDALFQLQLGPTDNCVQWPWTMVTINGIDKETKVDQVQRAVFTTVKSLVNTYCLCEADAVDWVYSCQTSSSSVVFKYALHLTSDHCACSGSKVVSIVDRWVQSVGTIRMGRYQFRASHECLTQIASFDDLDCKGGSN